MRKCQHQHQHQSLTISNTLLSSNHPSTEAVMPENNKTHKWNQNITLIV